MLKQENIQSRPYRRTPMLGSYVAFFCSVLLLAMVLIWVWSLKNFEGHDIAKVIRVKTSEMQVASQVRDRNNVEIGFFSDETRYPVPLKQIPPVVQDAFIAAEDDGFFSHLGVSPTGLIRAAISNLKRDRFAQGGSTITQQLVRQFLLPKEKTIARKLKEIFLSLTLERQMSKREILEKYLNSVYLGNNAWGVQAAAKHYFDKSVEELTLSEAAMLAGLPQAPTRYAPHLRPHLAKKRQEYVLNQMRRKLLISQQDYAMAKSNKLRILPRRIQSVDRAPWVTEAVRVELGKRLELKNLQLSGLNVKTTIDWRLQSDLQNEISKSFATIRRKGLEIAVVILDAKTGEILALVGGSDFLKSQFNRAIDLYRPFGASIYPLIFGWSIDRGLTQVDGYYSLAEAAVKSRFAEAEQLAPEIGYGTVREKLQAMGFIVKDAQAIDEMHGSPLSLARAYLGVAGSRNISDRGFIKSVSVDEKNLYSAEDGATRQDGKFDDATAWVLRQWMAMSSQVDSKVLSGQPVLKTIKEWNEWWLIPRTDVVIVSWVGADGKVVRDPRDLKDAGQSMDRALSAWISKNLRTADAIGHRPDGVSYQIHSYGQGRPVVRLPFVISNQRPF